MGAEAYEDYRAAIHDPATVHGMIEDYRAGLGIDRRHDEESRAAGQRVSCPTMVLWSLKDDLEQLMAMYLVSGVRGRPHFAAEGSTAGTTWQKRHQKSWPPSFWRS